MRQPLLGLASSLVLGLALLTPTLAAGQDIDQAYTEKILEYTTEPFFSVILMLMIPFPPRL